MSAEPDPRARLGALIADVMPVLEEAADCCETVSRSLRNVVLLANAGASAETMISHLETALAAFNAISALKGRVDDIARRPGHG